MREQFVLDTGTRKYHHINHDVYYGSNPQQYYVYLYTDKHEFAKLEEFIEKYDNVITSNIDNAQQYFILKEDGEVKYSWIKKEKVSPGCRRYTFYGIECNTVYLQRNQRLGSLGI